jgi:hypothetical protein
MYGFKTIFLVFLTLVNPACSVNNSAVKANEENQFWSEFRQAVLDNDRDKIVSMTNFPFEVRGPEDSDPVKRYENKDFPAIFGQLVAQQVFFPSAGRIVSKSMQQLIDEKKEITQGDFMAPDLIQFNQFEFERINGRWLFTRAYLEE